MASLRPVVRFAERDLWNIRQSGHWGFAPENFTTLPHFSVSSAISLPKSVGEPGSVLAPSSAIRDLILRSARAALISWLSLSTISVGIFFGAATPNHE